MSSFITAAYPRLARKVPHPDGATIHFPYSDAASSSVAAYQLAPGVYSVELDQTYTGPGTGLLPTAARSEEVLWAPPKGPGQPGEREAHHWWFPNTVNARSVFVLSKFGTEIRPDKPYGTALTLPLRVRTDRERPESFEVDERGEVSHSTNARPDWLYMNSAGKLLTPRQPTDISHRAQRR